MNGPRSSPPTRPDSSTFSRSLLSVKSNVSHLISTPRGPKHSIEIRYGPNTLWVENGSRNHLTNRPDTCSSSNLPNPNADGGPTHSVDKSIPNELAVHVISDNFDTHRHAAVKGMAGKPSSLPVSFHPTNSFWLNHVESWFGLVTERTSLRGSFTSIKDLTKKIDTFVEAYNKTATHFKWTATDPAI